MLANLATAVFEHCKITTTEARARRLRPVAERLITFAERGDLHARRQVLTVVTDRNGVHTLFAGIGPGFAAGTAVTPRSPGRTHGAGHGAPGHGRPCAAHCCAAPSLPKRQAATRPGWATPRPLDVADMMQKRLAGRRRGVTAGAWRRLSQGHLPLVQIAGIGRVLQWVRHAGRLVRAEHPTAPAA
jgi:hypothetical protein